MQAGDAGRLMRFLRGCWEIFESGGADISRRKVNLVLKGSTLQERKGLKIFCTLKITNYTWIE